MKLYKANKDYITYLRKHDKKVMDNKDPLIRPYWFCDVDINGQKFAIPLSSPKDATKVRFNQFTMLRVMPNSDELGRLYFINMIPFKPEFFTAVDKLEDQYDSKYKGLLYKQQGYLREQRNQIQNKARNVYNARYDKNHKIHSVLVANSCDFNKCTKYLNEYLLSTLQPCFNDKLSAAKEKADDHNKDLDSKENKSNDLER